MGLVRKSTAGAAVYVCLDRQIFTSSGTWTKPADGAGNVLAGTNKRVFARAIGGGGSGGTLTTGDGPQGGHGGGGVEAWFEIDDIGSTETVTIGAGGAEISVAGPGNAGGDTSFGSLCGATGGGGGRRGLSLSGYLTEDEAPGQGWANADAFNVRTAAGGKGGGMADAAPPIIHFSESSLIGGGGGGGGGGAYGLAGGNGGGGKGGIGSDGTTAGAAGEDCPSGSVMGGGGGGGSDQGAIDGGAGGDYGGGGGGGGDASTKWGGVGAAGALLVEVWGEAS